MTEAFLETMARRTRPLRHPVNTAVTTAWRLLRLPDQSWREIRILKEICSSIGRGTLRVFEWGVGRSTVYYPSYLRAIGREFEWYAVDHSTVWYERVKDRVVAEGLQRYVQVSCAEVPDACWRRCPSASPEADRAARYIEYPRTLDRSFDVVFVDGRFRRRCLLQAREVLEPHGVAVLHDAQRAYYHPAFGAYPFGGFVYGWRFPGSIPRSQMWLGSPACDVRRFLDAPTPVLAR